MARDLTPEELRASRFLLVVLSILAVASFLIVWPFLTGTIFAVVLGYLMQRPYRALRARVKRPWIAGGILVLLVIAVVVVPLVMVTIEIAQDIRLLVENAGDGGWRASVVRLLESLGVPPERADQVLSELIGQAGALIKAGALPTLGAAAQLAANVGIFIFLFYFVLVGGERLGAFVTQALPLDPVRAEHLLQVVGGRVRALFLGTFLVALIQGTLAGIGWWIFGFQSPVFWAFVMTLLAVIPAIGPIIVMAPAAIFAISQGDTFSGVGLLIWGLVVVGLVDNFTRPFIVGRSSDVHPGVVLLGTLGGLVVFGATGFIIGPLILSMVAPILVEWEAIRPGPG